jgi:hypothetical protein
VAPFAEFSVDVRGFTKELDRFVSHFEEDVWPTFVKKIALELLRAIVMGTPVDSGRARGNWQLTIGSPAAGEKDRKIAPGVPVMSGAAAAQSPGVAGDVEVEALTRLRAYSNFENIYLTNNLPYIVFLEEGHSDQAPLGFAELAVIEIENHLARQLLAA